MNAAIVVRAEAALRAAILRGARATPLAGLGARSARPGDGLIFSQLRTYVEGDDPRRIDHAASARSGALQTRVYVEETALVLAAIVDDSASMRVGRRRSLSDAADDALRAWIAAGASGDSVARIVDERVIRGARAAIQTRSALPFSLDRALQVAQRAFPRGASLLVVTDGFDLAGSDTLARAARRFDATILLAADPWSAGLPLRGIVRVADSERGDVRRIVLGPNAAARYARATRARTDALGRGYRALGWRVGELQEHDGRASLLAAFGVRA